MSYDPRRMVAAVLFDFGGVILSSPFDAFAAYERRAGLPPDFIRRVNSTDPDNNAWARLERNDCSIDEFVVAFEAEAAALGHRVDGQAVLACLEGELRPQMVDAVRRCREHAATALLTNNIVTGSPHWSSGGSFADLLPAVRRRDRVLGGRGVESPSSASTSSRSRQLGIHAEDAVFLDDLGINLKPARAMGMATIKVVDPDVAIAELEAVLGVPLR